MQQATALGTSSGGNREFVKLIARAATAVGVAGVFMEAHDNPDNAPSDGPCMIKLDDIEDLIMEIKAIDQIIKKSLQNN